MEVKATEARDDEHHEEPEIVTHGAENERINDPLTQPDAEVPRVPFGSEPGALGQEMPDTSCCVINHTYRKGEPIPIGGPSWCEGLVASGDQLHGQALPGT